MQILEVGLCLGECGRARLETIRGISDKARVIRELVRRAGHALRDSAKRVVRSTCDALMPKSVLGGVVTDLTRTGEELLAENAALRQQLIVLSREVKKPRFRAMDRLVLVLATAFVTFRGLPGFGFQAGSSKRLIA